MGGQSVALFETGFDFDDSVGYEDGLLLETVEDLVKQYYYISFTEVSGPGATNPPDYLHIGRSGAVTWRHRVDYPQDISLHHADEVKVILSLCHIAEMFDEVHDVGPIVHRILGPVSKGLIVRHTRS